VAHQVKGVAKVTPRKVIPDCSSCGHTGLSVEQGFRKQQGNEGHDMPVLVRESPESDLARKSIENCLFKLKDEKAHYERLFWQEELHTSLGNGHSNQALNLFVTESPRSLVGLYRWASPWLLANTGACCHV